MGIFRRSPSPLPPSASSEIVSRGSRDQQQSSSASSLSSQHSSSKLDQASRRDYSNASHPRSSSPSAPSPRIEPTTGRRAEAHHLKAPHISGQYAPASVMPHSGIGPPMDQTRALQLETGSQQFPRRLHETTASNARVQDYGIVQALGAASQQTAAIASPWAGYLRADQIASVAPKVKSKSKDKPRENIEIAEVSIPSSVSSASLGKKVKKPTRNEVVFDQQTPESVSQSGLSSRQLKRLELRSANRASAAGLARFSINGMLSLVEQRIQSSEEPTSSASPEKFDSNRSDIQNGALPPSSTVPYRRNPHRQDAQQDHEQEELLASATHSRQGRHTPIPTANAGREASISRASFSSTTSNATVLRDEVRELLLLARKASGELATRSSLSSNISAPQSYVSASGSAGTAESASASFDFSRSHSSASSHTGGSLSNSTGDVSKLLKDSSWSDSQDMASHKPSMHGVDTSTPKKKRKKFGLFGSSSKKSATTEEEQHPVATPASSNQPDAGPFGPSPLAPPMPRTGLQVPAASARISSPHYGALSRSNAAKHTGLTAAEATSGPSAGVSHRRKRSMSVPGPIPTHLLQAAGLAPVNDVTGRTRPAVYDESYFSALKQPHYATATNTINAKERQDRLARLGIVEDSSESPAKRKSRLALGRSPAPQPVLVRSAAAHPSSATGLGMSLSAQQRSHSPFTLATWPEEAQYAPYEQVSETQYSRYEAYKGGTANEDLRHGPNEVAPPDQHTGHIGHTRQQGLPTKNKHRHIPAAILTRSNSDASFIDPHLPLSQRKASAQRRQLAVPSPVPSLTPSDSLSAIGPPPDLPLPMLPTRNESFIDSTPTTAGSSSLRQISPGLGIEVARVALPASSSVSNRSRPGFSPAPSPAPTSPLPAPPSSVISDCEPAVHLIAPAAMRPTQDSPGYEFQLRPHRTQQQGRSKMSPVHELFPANHRPLSPASPQRRPLANRGIPQGLPADLDMALMPSPSPAEARRQRHDTVMTECSNYSTEGDFDEIREASPSQADLGSFSSTRMGYAGSRDVHSSNASSSSCSRQPTLSMDGHSTASTDDEDELSSSMSHEPFSGYEGQTFAVPHSKRMHFGWTRTAKATRNLATHMRTGVSERIVEEDELYENILGSYSDDCGVNDGYLGPDTTLEQDMRVPVSRPQRQKSHYAIPIRHTRSFDKLASFQ